MLSKGPRSLRMFRTVIAAVFVCAASTACRAGPAVVNNDARIAVLPGFHGATVGYRNSKPNLPYTVGDYITCLDRPGRVVVDQIDLISPTGGLTLDAFGVMPNAMERGEPGFTDDNRSLAEQGLLKSPVVIEQPCPDFDHLTPAPSRSPQSVALLLQFSKPASQTAGDRGLLIHYTSGGHKYQESLAWKVVLCAVGDNSSPGCVSQ